MKSLKIGDIVARKSYNCDVLFKVIDIIESDFGEKTMVLKGVELRIVADSPEEDLRIITMDEIKELNKSFNKKINNIIKNILRERSTIEYTNLSRSLFQDLEEKHSFGRPGKVLHIDGDGEYLDLCLKIYKQLDIEAIGKIIPEIEQPKVIIALLKEYNPDILVLTGHDSIFKDYEDLGDIKGYKHSKYFVEAVKKARSYETGMDELVIFAGACQSHYEAIIQAGANFASSPHRILMLCV